MICLTVYNGFVIHIDIDDSRLNMNDNHSRHDDEPRIIDEFVSLFFYD